MPRSSSGASWAGMGPRCTRHSPKRGMILLGAPEGDEHALPSAILADLLRAARFEVHDLGADTPTASLPRRRRPRRTPRRRHDRSDHNKARHRRRRSILGAAERRRHGAAVRRRRRHHRRRPRPPPRRRPLDRPGTDQPPSQPSRALTPGPARHRPAPNQPSRILPILRTAIALPETHRSGRRGGVPRTAAADPRRPDVRNAMSTSAAHTTHSRAVWAILEAPFLDTRSFASRCPSSAANVTRSRAVWAILEADACWRVRHRSIRCGRAVIPAGAVGLHSSRLRSGRATRIGVGS